MRVLHLLHQRAVQLLLLLQDPLQLTQRDAVEEVGGVVLLRLADLAAQGLRVPGAQLVQRDVGADLSLDSVALQLDLRHLRRLLGGRLVRLRRLGRHRRLRHRLRRSGAQRVHHVQNGRRRRLRLPAALLLRQRRLQVRQQDPPVLAAPRHRRRLDLVRHRERARLLIGELVANSRRSHRHAVLRVRVRHRRRRNGRRHRRTRHRRPRLIRLQHTEQLRGRHVKGSTQLVPIAHCECNGAHVLLGLRGLGLIILCVTAFLHIQKNTFNFFYNTPIYTLISIRLCRFLLKKSITISFTNKTPHNRYEYMVRSFQSPHVVQ